jgi:hypothetical protein
MAHYAFLDENNIVTEVIVGIDETELIDGLSPEEWYGNFRGQKCVRTSYNTRGNVHYGEDNIPGNGTAFRKNYAGIGSFYDETLDAFIPPKPFTSWVLVEEACIWEAPVSYPTDGKFYTWDEPTLSWVKVDV